MTVTAAAATGLPAKRTGVLHWLDAFRAMLRWEVTGMRLLLPLTVVVQLLFGAGFVLGIGLFFETVPRRTALFLSTGAGVITLVVVGLVMGPQLIANQRQQGTYDFMWSLPVPRSASAAAWIALNVMIAIPGLVGALLIAMWRYDVEFAFGWDLIPAVLLTLVTATLLGYALAHAVPNPEVTQIVSQLLIFVLVGFAPINFPPENLPPWLAELHEWLPFAPMAVTVRHGLTDAFAGDVGRAYVVLAAWAVAALGVVIYVVRRRK